MAVFYLDYGVGKKCGKYLPMKSCSFFAPPHSNSCPWSISTLLVFHKMCVLSSVSSWKKIGKIILQKKIFHYSPCLIFKFKF